MYIINVFEFGKLFDKIDDYFINERIILKKKEYWEFILFDFNFINL